MMKHLRILLFLLTLIFGRAQAQQLFSSGFGVSSSVYPLDAPVSPILNFPVSLHAIVKIKQHEFVAGPELYVFQSSPAIIGAQAAYRYYPVKEREEFEPFLEANFQFMTFRTGDSNPIRYQSAASSANDYPSFRYRSFVNTYGIGLRLNIKNRVMLYSIAGAGYCYYHQEQVFHGFSTSGKSDGNFIKFTAYLRLGVSLYFYRKK
jgi:hypothetical protein